MAKSKNPGTTEPTSLKIRSNGESYLRTHPWLVFGLPDTREWPARLWLALGEASSKCHHLAGVPLMPEFAKNLHRVFLAKGVHATAAIEGNTLTEAQVLRIVEGERTTPLSQKYLEQEITNVLGVANSIVEEIEINGRQPLTVQDIKDYNADILYGLELEDHVDPGKFRTCSVGVFDYKAPDWEDCDSLMERLCDWLNTGFEPPEAEDAIVYGIIKSVIAHVYLAWIHPFGDGNGRTARMLEVRFLMEAGVASSAVHLLSNHYNKTRGDYYRRLSDASKKDDLVGFLSYATRGFVDQLRMQILYVKRQQWHVAWVSYVHEYFGTEKTIADKRQICLLLALSQNRGYTPVQKLRHMSPVLAEMYANKTAKTISRDLNSLLSAELIERTKAGVRARTEIILAFLPKQKLDTDFIGVDYDDLLKQRLEELDRDLLPFGRAISDA
ncbi:Fic family protein [Brevundimonas vitis]|uniref:Fic family protein n=1 Tax=Brevundimonas vitisensis TaxID=2800818 RepID=A0ABX7BQL0_9CAUL|nr:Fic family protein [Brevundimonas vitisensis]QQQ17790.1 Fic family protein [Brevundimonas vitisensis]